MKKLVSLLIVFLIISCSSSLKNDFGNQIVLAYKSYEKTKIDGDIYLATGVNSYDIYISSYDNSIIQTEVYNLFYLYNKEYNNYGSFESFLNNIIDKKLSIKEEQFYKIGMIRSFILDKDLVNEYNNIGFEKFKNKYSSFNIDCNCYDFILLKDKNKSLTIKYIFYQNNFLTQSNSNSSFKFRISIN